jgi:hypothetical protein
MFWRLCVVALARGKIVAVHENLSYLGIIPPPRQLPSSNLAMVGNGKNRMARPPEPTVAAPSPPPLPPPSPPAADPPYPIVPPLVCAAGIWCTATTGDLANSPHYCFDCRGRIHCALFCGKILEDYMNSDSCKLDVNKLSSEGRDTFNCTSHDVLYICQMCINRHEGRDGSTVSLTNGTQWAGRGWH